MGTHRRILSIFAVIFAASIPFSFIACSDSNSTSAFGENPQAYSEPALESSSSLAPESSSTIPESSSVAQSSSSSIIAQSSSSVKKVQLVNDKECTAENEGVVETEWKRLFNGGPTMVIPVYPSYYRCENGSWNPKEVSVTCDTTGVKVGDVCTRYDYDFYSGYVPSVFKYVGNGVWGNFDGLEKMTKECNEENEGLKEELTYHSVDPNDVTVYYACDHGEWTKISETDYGCKTEKPTLGDTCLFVSNGKQRYYLYMIKYYDSIDKYEQREWMECTFDLKHGYCPKGFSSNDYSSDFNHVLAKNKQFLYDVSPEGYYYCDQGEWKPAKFVPRQYTDSRKSGLTDEEYDILDLPKEAKVGDREGGLLENCYNDVNERNYEISDYCMPKNYYRYRDNGTWTLETEQDR